MSINHLIIVPGHAPFRDSVERVPADVEQDSHWVLQPFQHGEPPYYIEHIRAGVEELSNDPQALLLFSGGKTRPESRWSEAATYAAIAKYHHYWTDDGIETLEARVDTEGYARDSFENLEASLHRFYQLLGRYPVGVTVVGWQFKAERFAFHAETLRIPEEHFTYIGCNNPADLADAMRGEKRALEQFRTDPRGLQNPLASKRAERNPFGTQNPYVDCPPIKIERLAN